MANIIVSETEVLITFQKQAPNLLPIVAGFDKVDPGPVGGGRCRRFHLDEGTNLS